MFSIVEEPTLKVRYLKISKVSNSDFFVVRLFTFVLLCYCRLFFSLQVEKRGHCFIKEHWEITAEKNPRRDEEQHAIELKFYMSSSESGLQDKQM